MYLAIPERYRKSLHDRYRRLRDRPGLLDTLSSHVDESRKCLRNERYAAHERPNSDLKTTSGAFGTSWLGDSSFFGGSVSRFESNYGSPTEEVVRVDPLQTSKR